MQSTFRHQALHALIVLPTNDEKHDTGGSPLEALAALALAWRLHAISMKTSIRMTEQLGPVERTSCMPHECGTP